MFASAVDVNASWDHVAHAEHRDAFESIFDGYYEADLHGRLLYCNQALCDLVDASRDDLLIYAYRTFLTRSAALRFARVLRHVFVTKKPNREFHFEWDNPSNDRKYLEASAALIIDDNGRVIGFRGLIRDVTRRRLAEVQLQQNEQRLRHLINALPDLIFLKDGEGRWLEANESALKTFGVDHVKYHGKTDLELADFSTTQAEALRYCGVSDDAAWRHGSLYGVEEHLTMPDGEVRIYDVTKIPTFWDDGKRQGLVVIARDISERRKFIEDLVESRERYESLINQHVDAILSLSLDGRIEAINPATTRIFGYEEDDVCGRLMLDLLYKRDRNYIKHTIRNLKAGVPLDHEADIVHKNGRVCSANIKLVPIVVENSTIIGLYAICRDITDQKEQQDAIERLSHQNELILNAADEGICGMDLQGRAIFSNSSALRMTGFDSGEMVGKSLHSMIHHTDESGQVVEEESCAALRALAAGEVYHGVDDMFYRKDGSSFPVDYVVSPIVENETIIGGVLVFRDITEKKQSEDMILRSEKLSVVGELAAGVAHEIRNPLTALKGFLQLMEVSQQFNEQYGEIMKSELNRIETITNELLMFSRPHVMKFRDRPLKDLVKSVIALISSEALLRGIVIEVSIENSLPEVYCEEDRLKQVFVNLLKNAMEAMPSGGTIYVEALRFNPGHVVVSITDEGVGISPDSLPHIGEPFFTTKEEGTGLGLVVSHRVVESHKGHLNIQSTVGEGTSVQVVLPLADRAREGQAHADYSGGTLA